MWKVNSDVCGEHAVIHNCEPLIPDKHIPVCFSDVGVCYLMVETISRVLERCRWTPVGDTLEVGFTHSCLTGPPDAPRNGVQRPEELPGWRRPGRICCHGNRIQSVWSERL